MVGLLRCEYGTIAFTEATAMIAVLHARVKRTCNLNIQRETHRPYVDLGDATLGASLERIEHYPYAVSLKVPERLQFRPV